MFRPSASLLLLFALARLALPPAGVYGQETTSNREDIPAARPNILFMIADDWGWNHAGAYGCTWVKTPTFDRVAREGLLFRHAFTSNPKCSPCRASILTGRNTWQLEEACCHNGLFPAKFAVYPDLLEQAGYAVGSTGKGWGPGDFRGGGFTRNPAGPVFDGHNLQPDLKAVSNKDLAANFADFLQQRKPGQPFCFWLGTSEPHRAYEPDAGIRAGKRASDAVVPGYLPDNDIVRRDLLDYAMEVEWGDRQFGRALQVLEQSGELENTLIVMTSDHGMPFPRVKGQIYEDGFHLPLAMRWGSKIQAGRVVDDFINVRDLAPTFLELAGLQPHPQMTGRSLTDVLTSQQSGWIDPARNVMLVGKERHDLGRPHDWGYPVRAIRTPEFLFVHNYEPNRWPAGNPETDFGNCDGSPTKDWLKQEQGKFYELAFGKRREFELYRISADPECLTNLIDDPQLQATARELRQRMESMLLAEEDPRALGRGEILESYQYVSGRRKAHDEWLKTQPARPNVLFLIADDLNCDLGAYGHPLVQSPHIDRLASRGLRFDQAYCQYPLCGPSRASFMCGLYPDQTGIHQNAIRIRERLENVETMTQMFRNQGYTAARVGKIFHYNVPADIGNSGHDDPASWDLVINPRGRDKTDEDQIFSLKPGQFGGSLSWLAAEGTDEQQTDGVGATEAIRLLERFAAERTPFFLAVGFYRPHTPYVAPRKYFDLYPLEQIVVPSVPAGYLETLPKPAQATLQDKPEQVNLPKETARQALQAYYASISFMDAQVGRVLEALEKYGLADDTIVVMTSDHGYHMGEHGHFQKRSLYENGARVPLIVSVPKMTSSGQSTRALVEMVDFYPTLAEWCHLTPPAHVAGVSFAPAVAQPATSPRDSALTQFASGYAVRTQRYRYVEWGPAGREGVELYDRDSDPAEMHNLGQSPQHAAIRQELAAILRARVAEAGRVPRGLVRLAAESAR